MTSVLACIDHSAYSNAVCDYAAWFAGRMQADVVLLNVRPENWPLGREMDLARQHLIDEGAQDVRVVNRVGRFAPVGAELAAGASIVLLGKRGTESDGDRAALGANVFPLLRAVERPVCLVSKVFLPITRAVVVLDSDPEHKRMVELVASHPALADLDVELVVMSDGRTDPEPKLEWARRMLSARGATAFPLQAAGAADAVAKYMQGRGCDLLIMSRLLLTPGMEGGLEQVETQNPWVWRTPLLIC